MRAPRDWWNGFFEGLMVDFWRAAVPDDGAKPEADFIESRLAVPPGARLLDVPCGHGRLALELASRGYRLTGLDLSQDFLCAARASAESRNLQVEWQQGDMREIPPGGPYDGAFCAGNSFGYFDDAGNEAFLRSVAAALKPGARFLLDSGWVAEAILPNFRDRIEMDLEGMRFLAENVYEPETGRVENRFTVSRGKRKVERLASHRIYAYREIVAMLASAGMVAVESYGALSGEPFRLGSHRLLMVARKTA
jgi:SAM-dependent methyltransferase